MATSYKGAKKYQFCEKYKKLHCEMIENPVNTTT
jgi:hypothetical protein